MSGPEDFRPLAGGPSFGLANKLARIAWGITWLLLCRWTPPPLFAWRAGVLRLFGAQIGQGARVHSSVRIWLPARIEIGEGALIGPHATLYNQGHIAIGAHCVVSQGAHLCASTHSLSDPHFALKLAPIRIERACWIAAEAFVGPGVTMAEGAVLSARGALFDNADEMGIYRGNPAVRIGTRG